MGLIAGHDMQSARERVARDSALRSDGRADQEAPWLRSGAQEPDARWAGLHAGHGVQQRRERTEPERRRRHNCCRARHFEAAVC